MLEKFNDVFQMKFGIKKPKRHRFWLNLIKGEKKTLVQSFKYLEPAIL
jgi:hypothetical protein